MDGYTLKTLGELSVLERGRRLPLGPPRECGLLVYLAFGIGRSLQREALIGILWDTGGSRERRHGLSQLVYSLRRRYPLLDIAATRDTIRLEGGLCSMDALRLLDVADNDDMEAACELFVGQFLEGFYITGAGGFEEWHESMARDLNGAGSRALGRRLKEAYDAGQWWLAERTANRLLELDPYDEHVHARRIKSIAADGDHARSVRELERTVDMIRRDLGQPPGRELRELIRFVGSGPLFGDIGTHEEPTVNRFVGRTCELQELRRVWSSVVGGRGAAVAVFGESGIGKSRLCRQLLRVAAVEGGRVFAGRCFESAAQLPFGALCQALKELRESDVAVLPSKARRMLETLLPELGSAASVDFAHLLRLEKNISRAALFDAIVQLITSMSQHMPIAIFIDDLQWADTGTIEALHYVAQATRDSAVLLIVTVRPEELPPAELTELVGGFHLLTLDSLNNEDAVELIETLDTQYSFRLPRAAQDRVYVRSAGRPFLIIELMRYLGGRFNSPPAATADELPAAVEALLARRLSNLSAAAGDILDVLVVLGGEATTTLLKRTTRLPSRRFVTAVEELQHRGIIHERGCRYAFIHELMQETVERRVSLARRRWLRNAAAKAVRREMPGR